MAEVLEPIRTDMNCHHCTQNFIAELDAGIDGKHCVECPKCGHRHYRVIKDGVITGARWDSDNDSSDVIHGRSVWKSGVIPARTSTVSQFIRDRWINRSDFNGHQ